MFDSQRHQLLCKEKEPEILISFLRIILIIRIMVQVTALLWTLEFQESAKRKGHFALFNCLVLWHTRYNGVQRVYCNHSAQPAQSF